MELHNPQPEDLLCNESFLRYCRGEVQADTERWQQWMLAAPGREEVVATAIRLYDVLSVGQGNRQEQLAALKDALARKEQFRNRLMIATTGAEPAPVAMHKRWRTVGYAASILAVASLGILGYIKYQKSAGLTQYEYYTAHQNRKTVVLPDNSVIMLNENSHLSVSSNFDAQHREVTITGEAFFDIASDASHPFIVHTKGYDIRVLGTSFNVKSYPGSTATETGLITGKVEIVPIAALAVKDRVILQPREKYVWNQPSVKVVGDKSTDAGTGMVESMRIDTLSNRITETAWARSRMEIKNQTMAEIAKKLEAWYGIEIVFENESVKTYRYTASFDDETIFTALQYLQQSYPFTYTIRDNRIILSRS